MSVSISIKKKYSDFTLDVEFETDSSRIGILGASGCGKSLTLKSIAGLIRPDEGRIVFEDKVLFDSKSSISVKAQKRSVGYLFQDYALFPNMTVYENIEAAAGVKNTSRISRKSATDEIIKQYDLYDIKDHLPSKLSGGQKQRCALARIEVSDPDMILLDEPFSAMDTFLREGLRLELIKRLDEYDKTFIIVSHDRDEIYQMCDHLVLMQDGKVLDHGPVDELFAHPKSSTAARLTGCKNISRIERISSNTIRALDWGGLTLSTAREVTSDMKFAGIRAHDFSATDSGTNIIPTGKVSISTLPFEWYVTLENGLWWKLAKDLDCSFSQDDVPKYISIAEDKIILMKE